MFVLVLAFRMLRGARIQSPYWSRLALVLMPFLVLASIDRVAGVAYRPIQETEGLLQPHPTRLWTNRPNFVETRLSTTYRINSAGLRGPEIPLEKGANERHILFLGDSVAYCLGVNRNDCFVWQIEELFAAHGTSPTVRAINCSVSGYSPWQEYDILADECMDFQPDLIVQVFCLNDIGQKFNLAQFGGDTRDLAPRQASPLEWSGLFRMSRALTFQYLGPTRAELAARDQAYGPGSAIDRPNSPEIKQAWRVTLGYMDEIVLLAHDAAVPLTIVVFPVGRQVEAVVTQEDAPQEKLASYCRSVGIPLLDLLDTYRASCSETGVCGAQLFPDQMHPSPLGNRIAAQAIFDHLGSIDWLEGAPDGREGRDIGE